MCPPPKMSSLLVILCLLATICTLLAKAHPTETDADIESTASTADPESLPPDTFRKLAQALYQRGDKKEQNRMQRKFLYNPNVTCNDGSAAGFYIRRNYQSKRWIIFLEGKTTTKTLIT